MRGTLTEFRVAIPAHLQRRLQDTLGSDASEDLVSWMDTADQTRADVAGLRHEMQIGFARMDARFAALETLIERRTADLMKWSFVFWVGAVAAIAMLAGVLP
jgi:hypothetical protein